MKIVVASDNHLDFKTLQMILDREKGTECFIHCGDSQFKSTDIIMQSFIAVRGNNDESTYQNECVVELGEIKALVTHGHLYGIDFSTDEICESARIQGATVVFHGHTHIPRDIMVGDIRVINPGSTSWPRGGFTEGTYAVIDAADNDVVNWDIQFISTKTWKKYESIQEQENKKWWQF